jgi:serine/threonine protein kinase
MPAVDDFLKTVLRSGLLDREQLQQTLRTVPVDQRDDPDVLAAHLVKAGKLTRFQSRKLLQGTALGLVLGPFQVLAPIGKGGMGTVYLSRDTRSGQLVALKVLPPKRAREEERVLARFQREMEMCQRVAHPNIAWTCDVGKCQGVYYIAMEFIPGRSLSRLVAAEGPLPAARAARLLAEIAAALDHAHHQGIIHRDIKPSNIIVTPNDHAKLLDLGLALARGESGGAREVIGGQGYIVGTMDYISPEQADDPSKVDARSDLYSLGCTLYFALTGQPPFPGGTAAEKIQRHKTEQPTPVPQLNSNVPPAFIGLLRKLMAKKPAQRPASAAAVREELLAWAGGEAVLPMDRPEDDGYREAVAKIENAEPSTEENCEALPSNSTPLPAPLTTQEQAPPPVVEPLAEPVAPPAAPPPAKRRGRPSALALSHSARPPRPAGTPALVVYMVAGGVALFCLGSTAVLGALGLLWYVLAPGGR